MRDPCQADLRKTPHTTSAAGWLWSQQNPPEPVHEALPGKWMLFPRCGEAVVAWRTVAQAAHAGQLWLAKIAPRTSRDSHLICVYTPDFTDRPAVEAVAHQLDDLGLVHRSMYYKPDVFTYAGIYARSGGRTTATASIYEYVPQDRRIHPTAGLPRALELLTNAADGSRGNA